MGPTLLAAEILPETFRFLHVGWFIVHLVAIPLALLIGYAIGKSQAGAPKRD